VLQITALIALLSPNSATRAQGGATDTARMARVRAVVDSAVTARTSAGIPGMVVGVFRDTTPLYVQAAGRAVIATSTPYRTTQRQPIASITKQFTAVAVLMLADSGRLNVDDPVSRWIAGLPSSHAALTVRQLLNHMSGLGRFETRYSNRQPASSDESVQAILNMPTEFAPGARFSYSNANYVLLGAIIERITGRRWSEHMQRVFFTPLGMRTTAPCEPTPADSLVGYMKAGGPATPRPPVSVLLTGAAGALCSTVYDLARWATALHGGRLLSARSYALLQTPPVIPGDPRHAYAMGVVRAESGPLLRLWHNGALNSGFASHLAYYPRDTLTIVLLSNAFPNELQGVDAAVYRAWRGVGAR
jgi:CubicO group peptidase (beta-lactamase class C family)